MKTTLIMQTFVAGAIFLSMNLNAQESNIVNGENDFSISVQIRPRSEYRNGAYRPLQKGESPAILVNNRARLTMDYANKNKLSVRISAQNVNVWGQDAQVQPFAPTSGSFSLFEAFGQIQLHENFSAKIGRQTIILDDERIFGGLDWHPAGRSHDALNLRLNPSQNVELQSYVAFNQNYKAANWNVNNPAGQYFNPSGAQLYQHMEMLYGKFSVGKRSNFSIMLNNLGFKKDQILNNTIENDEVQNMQTIGANWFGNYGQWKSQLSLFFQTGKNEEKKNKNAYMVSGSVGYQVANPVGITVGFDYLSGDNYGGDATAKSAYFDPLYGTHHKFYGTMDYYYVAGAHKIGLADAYLNLALRRSEKTSLALAGHFFNAAGNVYHLGKKMSKNLGGEVDLTLHHQIFPMVALSGGYSVYLHTPTLRIIKNTPDARDFQDWLWLSVNINPKIFITRF